MRRSWSGNNRLSRRDNVRFLIDADLSPTVAYALEAAGHDCVYVPDVFAPRTADPVIAVYARQESRCIITRDFGFSDIRRYVPRDHHGIVVLTVPPEGGSRYIFDLVREVIMHVAESQQSLTGKLLIVEPGRIRIRE